MEPAGICGFQRFQAIILWTGRSGSTTTAPTPSSPHSWARCAGCSRRPPPPTGIWAATVSAATVGLGCDCCSHSRTLPRTTEMFGQCLDQQPGLKTWMAAQNISDYGGLQQYFTRRLRSQVLSPLRPAPAVVVWEDDDSSAVADSSLGAADIGQVYGGDGCKPHRSCGALAEPGSAFLQLSRDGVDRRGHRSRGWWWSARHRVAFGLVSPRHL